MKSYELYTELRKKLEFDDKKINLENVSDDEKKKLLQLCDYNEKVALYELNEGGHVIELAIWPNDQFSLPTIFPNLEKLYVYRASDVDLSFLKDYHTLKTLGLSYCNLDSIPDFSNQPDLEDLNLYYSNIKKIEGLDHLTKLTRLGLDYNKITRISGLEKLKNLKALGLMNNKFSKIEGLENLVNLEMLSISENRGLDCIGGLNNLKKLTQLGMSQCSIEDVDGFREFGGFNNLYFLSFGMNKITEIDVKETLPALEKLYLYENKIQKVRINGNFPALTELELQKNNITEIQTISNLPKLKYLRLDENKFETLENLSNLPSLTNVGIDQTPVKHIENLNLPKDCMISNFLEENFSTEERTEMEQQIKSLGLRDYWVNERYYWD